MMSFPATARRGGRITAAPFLPAIALIISATITGRADAQTDLPGTSAGQQQTSSADQRLQLLEDQLKQQQAEIEALKQRLQEQDDSLAVLRGRGVGADQGQAPSAQPTQAQPSSDGAAPEQASAGAPTPGTVGEAPSAESEQDQLRAHVAAVPEGQGVLTPKGTFVLEPSFEYVQSSTNRLVFRGVELVPGIQLGIIEASTADRNTLLATQTVRYGITNRLEAEVRVPGVYRHDTVQVVQQRDQGIVRSLTYDETDIGDVEFSLRYQLNSPKKSQEPIFVGSLRVKSDTGKGPFDVGYDEFGIATGLATGSGFWAIQPGINFLLPSDPVVIYGSASYLHNIPKTINKTIGGALVGHVTPGDAISGNLGFGFALNPRFSFSLGYEHTFIFPTTTEIGGTFQKSSRLQVGAFVLGMSYRLSETKTMNWNFEIGATSDAPNVAITLRLPFDL